jgi:hypothetical protein
MKQGTRWLTSRIIVLALACASCAPDFKDGLGPRVPIANVDGTVTRQGAPVARLSVDLRDVVYHSVIDSTKTSASGVYGFADVATGRWEIKVSGKGTGDFDSVSREFDLSDSAAGTQLKPFDVFAYGAALLEPTSGANVPVPSLTAPLRFSWNAPSMTTLTARVQVFDSLGADVWFSPQTAGAEIIWNGLGNQGPYLGQIVSPALYSWRVKFLFPDSTEARTLGRSIVLQ